VKFHTSQISPGDKDNFLACDWKKMMSLLHDRIACDSRALAEAAVNMGQALAEPMSAGATYQL